jgi:DNA polymerase III gamma/tau subunit
VREALGLIGDELYAELLGILAEARAGDVLPLVERLVESGADLAEFAGGLGEVLRALLQQTLGSEPAGQSEVLRQAVTRHAAHYRPGDVLRMLRLLGEAEESIRRSPHARLHVETLLLQLALLDRTVELAEVLEALGERAGRAEPAERADRPADVGAAPAPSASPAQPDRPARAAPSAPSAPSAPPAPPARSAGEGEVVGRWSEVVEAVGQKSRMLREALSHAAVSVEDEIVVLEVAASEVHLQGLENGRKAIEAALLQVLGKPTRVRVQPGATGSPAAEAADAPPRRLSRDTEREERLQRYRAKDPGLNAAADALDLELLE